MRGICFKEPLFRATVAGEKTVTRRLNSRYRIGETLFLKEPYMIDNKGAVHYKYSAVNLDQKIWKNKLFMPEHYARYFIGIMDKRQEYLQDITEEECIKEGIGLIHYFDKDIIFVNKIDNYFYTNPKDAFKALFEKINGEGTWDKNPIVTRYEYKLIDY